MITASVAELRSLDALPARTPRMQIAALALADFAEDIARRRTPRVGSPFFLALAGHGNNGGDVVLACEELARRGFRTEVRRVETHAPSWTQDAPETLPRGTILLDGLLGIGFKPPLRANSGIAAAIAWANRAHAAQRAFVIACDIPSGLPAENGTDFDPSAVLTADVTLTMGRPKPSFLAPHAMEFTGPIEVAEIDYPAAPSMDRGLHAIWCGIDDRAVLAPRPRAAHKGSFPHVHIFAGTDPFPGAGVLVTLGALRGGAGLVSAHVPTLAQQALATRAPEAILDNSSNMDLRATSHGYILEAGSGYGDNEFDKATLISLLENTTHDPRHVLRGIVLDAGALHPDVLERTLHAKDRDLAVPVILTPHPGEAARILGTDVATILRDPADAAMEISSRYAVVTVLKGAGTFVAPDEDTIVFLPVGTPALGKGGSGDILAGLIAARLAIMPERPAEAACSAVYAHGWAAWRATLARDEHSFTPTDLL